MKKVQEPMVIKTLTVATSRICWQPLVGLVAAIVVMSVVLLSGQELKHVPPAAPSYMVLHTFAGSPTDGDTPYAGLIQDAAGNLYGTTTVGGAYGNGVVFKLGPTGTETVLHSFSGGDGATPQAGLTFDAAGNLYGTTEVGGAKSSACALNIGCGTVFKLSATGTETVLYTFTGGADGAFPGVGVLLRDAEGDLYGTTIAGGESSACAVSTGATCGVVFKLSSNGTETVLYAFTGGADGAGPVAGLTRDAAGNLYGTTVGGGAHNTGVVFELIRCNSEPSGYEYEVLHSFTGGADGAQPFAGLVRDAAGNLYGTTASGGADDNGVVFELVRCSSVASGYEFKVLHTFTGYPTRPLAGLTRDAAGNLYGTTAFGGAYGGGAVFKLSSTGTYTVLHSFTGGADGVNPLYGSLVQDAAGNLYGTTWSGPPPGYHGVVFKLTP
jgi:uncharacterized repeat protein (TIGR03803 family)